MSGETPFEPLAAELLEASLGEVHAVDEATLRRLAGRSLSTRCVAAATGSGATAIGSPGSTVNQHCRVQTVGRARWAVPAV